MKTVCFHKRTVSGSLSLVTLSLSFSRMQLAKLLRLPHFTTEKKKHLFFFNRYLYMYNCVSVEPWLYNKKNTFFIMLKGFLFS